MVKRWLPAGMLACAMNGLPAQAEEPWMPTQHDLDRYEHIWKAAPFIAATEVTPKGESIAQRFALTGFARLGESEIVFLFDRKSLNRFSVSKSQPQNGVELLAVAEKDTITELGARIRAEGEVAEITYDGAVANASETSMMANGNSQPPPQPVPAPNRPGIMSGSSGNPSAAQANLPPNPPTGTTSQAQIMSGAPANAQVSAAPTPPTRRVIRRRQIVTQPTP